MTILTMNDELIAGKKWFWRLGTCKNALSVHQTVTTYKCTLMFTDSRASTRQNDPTDSVALVWLKGLRSWLVLVDMLKLSGSVLRTRIQHRYRIGAGSSQFSIGRWRLVHLERVVLYSRFKTLTYVEPQPRQQVKYTDMYPPQELD
jgi:hypothetical protein